MKESYDRLVYIMGISVMEDVMLCQSQREKELKIFFFQLPDKVRTKPERRSADDTLTNILNISKSTNEGVPSAYSFKNSHLNKPPKYLEKPADLRTMFSNVYDWHFTFLSSGKNSPDLRIFIGKMSVILGSYIVIAMPRGF